MSLYRLVSFSPLKLEQRNVSFIGAPHRLLFCKDLLLVSDWNETTRSHGILSLRASGGGLNEPRKLFDTVHYYSGFSWAFVGNQLILSFCDKIFEYPFTNDLD